MDGLMLTLFNHICIHVRIVRVHLFFDSEIFFAIKMLRQISVSFS